MAEMGFRRNQKTVVVNSTAQFRSATSLEQTVIGISDLQDLSISGPVENDILVYSDGLWKNKQNKHNSSNVAGLDLFLYSIGIV